MASMQELVAAITEGKVDSIPQILQSSPFLLNARLDSGGTTPLILAAMRGREGVVRLLLEMGANVQAHDDAGMTPLHVATQYCRADVAKVLIENGALLDVQNNHGWTPLHEAASRAEHQDLVRLLIRSGANVHIKGKRTAYDLARVFGRVHTLQVFRQEVWRKRLQIFLMGTARKLATKSIVLMLPIEVLAIIATETMR
eukprot:c15279_g1_i2.p1 GENE.c15279_g1_i2~~c15279_g1_i2.p1  ORF type:complete len:210 (+),score=32.45 c15279_g1_i2:34-630(+)